MTCADATDDDKESVAQAQEERREVDMAERVERGQLGEKDQYDRHHDDEMVQFQRAIWEKARVHYLRAKMLHKLIRQSIDSTKNKLVIDELNSK